VLHDPEGQSRPGTVLQGSVLGSLTPPESFHVLMLVGRAGLVCDHEAGADGYGLGSVVVGPDPGGNLLHAPSLQPGDHSDGSFGGEALALPWDAHEPSDLGRLATPAEDRLEHPDRHPVNEPTDDPVELGCRIGGGAVRGEPAKGASQAFHGAALSAGEPVNLYSRSSAKMAAISSASSAATGTRTSRAVRTLSSTGS
jgi:hypothetical protein